MIYHKTLSRLRVALCGSLLLISSLSNARAQAPNTPLTSQELVRLIYQLPGHPEKRDEVIEEIRKRGLGFPLTDGMRSVVASKSGNDSLIRRTLEEAERRRLNPVVLAPPSAAEAGQVLEQTRQATLGVA